MQSVVMASDAVALCPEPLHVTGVVPKTAAAPAGKPVAVIFALAERLGS